MIRKEVVVGKEQGMELVEVDRLLWDDSREFYEQLWSFARGAVSRRRNFLLLAKKDE